MRPAYDYADFGGQIPLSRRQQSIGTSRTLRYTRASLTTLSESPRAHHNETEDTVSTRIRHDFSQLSLYPEVPNGIQPKLEIGAPNDQYEQEADRVADQVMRMPETTAIGAQGPSLSTRQTLIQRSTPEQQAAQANVVRLSKATGILSQAQLRHRHNSLVAQSYNYSNPFVFCPNGKHSNALSKYDILHAASMNTSIPSKADLNRPRRSRRLGKYTIPVAYARPNTKIQVLASMPGLGFMLQNWPAGEYITYLGMTINKCNLFVFHVLHQAGYHFLSSNGFYPGAANIANGGVTGLTRLRWYRDVLPGDIFASPKHTGIVASPIKYGYFTAIEYYGSLYSTHRWKASKYKFFKVAA